MNTMRIGVAVLLGMFFTAQSLFATGPRMRVWLVDGGYVDGNLSCDASTDHIICDSPLFAAPLQFDVGVVQSITKKNTIFGRRYKLRLPESTQNEFGSPARGVFPRSPVPDWRRSLQSPSLEMQLVSEGVQLAGWLVDRSSTQDGRLLWQTALSRNASEIDADSHGKITIGSPRREEVSEEFDGALPIVFRSGDAVNARVNGIDSSGVRAQWAGKGEVLITGTDLQSVTLTKVTKPLDVDPRDLQRVLVMPRAQQDTPPSHLVVSVTGDLLRCNVLELKSEVLVVEVRSKAIELPRDRVAKIVWLHPQSESQPKYDEFLVHAVLVDKREVTLRAFAIEDQKLTGQSRAFAEFEVPLSDVKSIHFGRDPVAQASDRVERDWTIESATVPMAYRDEPPSKAPALGVASPLIGKPAPDFDLKTIEGESFDLASLKGRVVVLDFWASWSAPSLRGLSEFSQAILEVGGNDVAWVAINLEESAASASRAIERVSVDAAVLMDVDGDAAYVYQAKSLPHTVILDRRGVVVTVIDSSTPKRLEVFRQALSQVFTKPK
ncbi:TlpA family protein disulfide reductase [Novipirellula sp. SH528]|uniref:TlpA family protein disulfide reductase n=1 Tax=Novipirellula sp. SH528 TaxID=3454466 RepID=UPI003FA12E26